MNEYWEQPALRDLKILLTLLDQQSDPLLLTPTVLTIHLLLSCVAVSDPYLGLFLASCGRFKLKYEVLLSGLYTR